MTDWKCPEIRIRDVRFKWYWRLWYSLAHRLGRFTASCRVGSDNLHHLRHARIAAMDIRFPRWKRAAIKASWWWACRTNALRWNGELFCDSTPEQRRAALRAACIDPRRYEEKTRLLNRWHDLMGRTLEDAVDEQLFHGAGLPEDRRNRK